VLVVPVTSPAWTPLFAIASAIVTEVGGVLGHTAVVAREYALPAVVNVRHATRLLRDGQLVEVDGSAGVVRVLG
jgi:pyruvate,water dikinase